MSILRSQRTLRGALLLPLALSASCADPKARFDEFVERYEEANPATSTGNGPAFSGALPTPEQAEGEFLLAISITLNRKKPIVNLLQVKAAKQGQSLELQIRYQPLLASDRKTPAGEFGPWQTLLISPDGKYNGESVHGTVPALANPITGQDSEADLALGGSLSVDTSTGKVNFLCGDVTGKITSPLPLGLAGSTFTAVRIEDPSHYPNIVINCHKDPADPL